MKTEKFRFGHPKSEENIYRFSKKPWSGSTIVQQGERCRACQNARQKSSREERLAGRPVMTPSEVARLGGLAVSEDRKHMSEMGKKGGAVMGKNTEHMARIGKKGGTNRGKNLKLLKTTLTTLALMILGACTTHPAQPVNKSVQDQLEVFQKKRWIRIQRDEQERQYYRRQREAVCPEVDKSKCI